MAKRFVPASEMAALLDIDEDELKLAISTHGSPARRAYMAGMAKSADNIRTTNIELAEAGTPEAIRNCFSSIQRMINDLSE